MSLRLNPRLEVVSFQPWPDRSGYFKVQVAVDGKLSWPFDVHEGDWGQLTEEQREAYLLMSATTLLGRYGDARKVKIREDGQIVPRFGEVEGLEI